MAPFFKHRLVVFAFVSMCILLISDTQLARDKKKCSTAVRVLEKADHHQGDDGAVEYYWGAVGGEKVMISQQEGSPEEDEEGLEVTDYTPTRGRTPIHN